MVRRQGKGTFVARHDEARILFQFFKLIPDSGKSEFPESQILSVETDKRRRRRGRRARPAPGRADRAHRAPALARRPGLHFRAHRCCRAACFPAIEKRALPNNLYELYRSDFGVTMVRAEEKLKAVAAGKREAKHLGLAPGAPLLSIDRRAIAADGRPAEWRVSLCRTDRSHYLSD